MANGKTVIVTGASQGIGAVIVRAFLERSYNVVATSRSILKAGYVPSANLALVEAWIGEAPTDEIVAKLHTSLGDVNAITTAVARNLGIAASFAEFFNRPSVTHEMQILSLRVRHGVKEDVLDLAARVPGVGRVRARSFARAGFFSPKSIAEAGVEELTLKTGMFPGVLEPIQAACLGILENSSPKKTEQRTVP